MSQPQQHKISVKVQRAQRAGDLPTVTSNYALPSSGNVVDQLNKRDREKAMIHWYPNLQLPSLIHYVGNKVKTKAWSDAIAKAIADIVADGSATTEFVARSEPAYLSVGNAVFQLNCTDWIGAGPRALPGLRRRIVAQAEEEREKIINLANEQANETRRKANSEANQVRRELITVREQIVIARRELAELWKPPDWINNNNIPINLYSNYGNTHFRIFFSFSLKINRFIDQEADGAGNRTGRVKVWNAVGRSFIVRCWLTICKDGTYDEHNFALDESFNGSLPHMDHWHSCMEIADKPPLLNSMESYNQLKEGLARAMSAVNMGSILCWDWSTLVKRTVPTAIRRYMHPGHWQDMTSVPPDLIEEPTSVFHAPEVSPPTIEPAIELTPEEVIAQAPPEPEIAADLEAMQAQQVANFNADIPEPVIDPVLTTPEIEDERLRTVEQPIIDEEMEEVLDEPEPPTDPTTE